MLKIVVFGCMVLVLAGAAFATPITGELDTSGDVSVGATTIDWLPAGTGTGTFLVTASSTGTFSGLVGTTGTTKDLDVTLQPVGVPISLPGFMVLPGISIELTMLDAGVFGSTDCLVAAAPGQTCTPVFPPPKSPFNLTNTAVGSTASFTIHGIATSGTSVQDVTGTYTTQFTGQNYQSILSTIAGGGSVQASYSANFIFGPEQGIPEPSTAYLALGGLVIGVASVLRRRLIRN